MADLDYIKVVGRLGLVIADTIADPDENPDTIWCNAGEVWFTPLIGPTKVVGAFPVPATLGQSTIKAKVNVDGYLTLFGTPGLWLVDLTSTKLNPFIGPGNSTHSVEFKGLTANDIPVSFETFNARIAPDTVGGNGACDLTFLAPVSFSGGTPVTMGPQGLTGADSTVPGPQGATGLQGPQGIQGFQGVTGAQGAVGPAGLNWRGIWSNATDYVKDDAVSHEGASWFASADPPLAAIPSEASIYWQALSLRGLQGVQGAQGIQGAQGATGPTGPANTDASLLSSGTVPDPRLPTRLSITTLNADFKNVGELVAENEIPTRLSVTTLDSTYKNVGEAVTDVELGRVGGRNLIDDASAVRYAGASGWIPVGGGAFTISENARLWGTAGLLITPSTGTYSGIAVSPSPNTVISGEKVVLSVWVRSAVARNLDFSSDQLTGATATVDGVVSATGVGAVPIPANNVWVRVVVRGTVAAAQNKVDWYFRTNNSASIAQFTISEPTIQRGVVPTDEPGIAWRQADARYILSNDSGWLEIGSAGQPAFENGWVNYAQSWPTAAYKKVGNRIHMKGLIMDGTMNLRAFSLPVGHRPLSGGTNGLHIPAVSNGLFGYFNVGGPSGEVRPAGGTNVWIDLSSISFITD